MIASRSQNQLQSSLAPLGDLLKALMFLSNLNDFNSSPSPPVQGFNQRKGSSKVWKKKNSKWFYHILLCSCFCLLHYLCVLLLFWVNLVLYFVLFNIFLFVYFQFFYILFLIQKFKKKSWKIRKIQKQCVLCVHWYLCSLDGQWNKISKFCIFCNLDEHLYAQLSKWALWLLFVMSKIELSLILNTRITLFNRKN